MIRLTSAFSCRECRAHLPAYLHRELKPRLRRRVAQHLNGCPACYAQYRAHRDLAQELSSVLPRVGAADSSRLGKIWSGVQMEMAQPKASRYRARFSMAAAALVATLALPWALGSHQRVLAVPDPPTPQTTTLRDTPAVETDVAVATAEAPSVTSAAPPATPPAPYAKTNPPTPDSKSTFIP
jgi:anti-sigma factor RsiW